MPVLSFVGTGIGILGFVIFFGGFILWTRFDAVGLPADEAVWHVPRDDLVVTGASFLVPALLTALVAVASAYALRDTIIGARRRRRIDDAKAVVETRERELAGHEAAAAAAARDHEAASRQLEHLTAMVSNVNLDSEIAKQAIDDRKALNTEEQTLRALQSELETDTIPKAQAAVDAARKALDDAHDFTRAEQLRQRLIGAGPMLAVCAFIGIRGWGSLPFFWSLLPLLLLTAASVTLSVIVLRATNSFTWFALSVFLGVGIIIAASTYARTDAEAKVSPVALVSGGVPHTGYFIAETPDAIYLGQPRRATGNPDTLAIDTERIALVRLDKAKISDLRIGNLVSEPTAYVRALGVAMALCDRQLPPPATTTTVKAVNPTKSTRKTKQQGQTTTSTEPEHVCGAQDIADLRAERDAAQAALASSRPA
jgi:hypothetical protein